MATIRLPSNQQITPAPHVQAFADALEAATGADSFGTYYGHSPTPERAIDIFHQVGDNKLADAICDFYVANWRRFGGDYIISRQRIWNPEISFEWRWMTDRGNNTQNHYDHSHISFEASAPMGHAKPKPIPILNAKSEEGSMLIVNVSGGSGGIWLVRPGRPAQHIAHPDHVQALVKIGIPYEEKKEIPSELFDQYLRDA